MEMQEQACRRAWRTILLALSAAVLRFGCWTVLCLTFRAGGGTGILSRDWQSGKTEGTWVLDGSLEPVKPTRTLLPPTSHYKTLYCLSCFEFGFLFFAAENILLNTLPLR